MVPEDVVDLMHSAYTSKVAISGIASLELGVADGDWMLGQRVGTTGCPHESSGRKVCW